MCQASGVWRLSWTDAIDQQERLHLSQVINFPTRGQNTLDPILTSMAD